MLECVEWCFATYAANAGFESHQQEYRTIFMSVCLTWHGIVVIPSVWSVRTLSGHSPAVGTLGTFGIIGQ